MSAVMLARSHIRSHPSSALSLNMARVGREYGLRKPGVKARCGDFWRLIRQGVCDPFISCQTS